MFDAAVAAVASAQQEFPQIYPRPGWVEHDPEAIWASVTATMSQALRSAELTAGDIAALGITNQRETVVVWDRHTGRAIHNAIVWQDRRTAAICEALERDGHGALIAERTGLRLDPYFSATKIVWLLDNVEGARAAAEAGSLAFGTMDSFLLWRLTGGAVHRTDATNACRTLLLDIHRGDWDADLLRLFGIPRAMLPEVYDSAGAFGSTTMLGAPIGIHGVAGDQQAALIGQGCFRPGMVKSTYGTGCFALLNTGSRAIASDHRLVTTIAYQLNGRRTYALEGSIFVAGAAVQWLRDGLHLIRDAAETEGLAAGLGAAGAGGVYMVPAFTGLGAPHWDPDARGAIYGLTRATGPAELARAALESTALQTHDLLRAVAQDGVTPAGLKVDGGMVANDWFCQALADVCDLAVERPAVLETTALGAACLGGGRAGVYGGFDEFRSTWALQRRFEPEMDARRRTRLLSGWNDAVGRTLARSA